MLCLRRALERFRSAVTGPEEGGLGANETNAPSKRLLKIRPSGPPEGVFTGGSDSIHRNPPNSAYSIEDLQRNGRFNPNFAGGNL